MSTMKPCTCAPVIFWACDISWSVDSKTYPSRQLLRCVWKQLKKKQWKEMIFWRELMVTWEHPQFYGKLCKWVLDLIWCTNTKPWLEKYILKCNMVCPFVPKIDSKLVGICITDEHFSLFLLQKPSLFACFYISSKTYDLFLLCLTLWLIFVFCIPFFFLLKL